MATTLLPTIVVPRCNIFMSHYTERKRVVLYHPQRRAAKISPVNKKRRIPNYTTYWEPQGFIQHLFRPSKIYVLCDYSMFSNIS